MSDRPRLALLALGALLGFWSGVRSSVAQEFPAAASAQGSGETTLHLHGTVVDGITGKPVPRALVTSLDRRLGTMTNAEGAFAFEIVTDERNLLQGRPFGGPIGGGNQGGFRVFLGVQKPGYLQPSGHIIVGFNGSSAETTLKLMPAGVIAGHVSASGSDSPSNVMVALLSRNSNNGERTWATSGMQRTDRTGGFRFTNLRPGEYTVMTSEWRGDEPMPPQRNGITEQYPPVYFGDSATMAGSTRLHLHFGEVAQADLHLRVAKYYPVTVPVAGSGVGINVQVNSGEASSGYRLGYNQAEHAVEGSLPTGTYTLRVSSMGPQQSYGTAVLHVGDGPLRTAPLTLVPPLPITVRFHTVYSGKQTPPDHVNARVYLQPEVQPAPFASGSPLPGQDEVIVPDVAPGRYTVHVEPTYGYVASIQSAGMDLLTEPLVVGEGEAVAPIDVTLRDDSGQVSGTVTAGEGSPAEGTGVAFLPASPVAKFMVVGIGPDGKFTLTSVAPGSYVVIAATEQVWQFPYRDPEAMRALAGKGVEITVAPGGTQEIEVPVADPSSLELP